MVIEQSIQDEKRHHYTFYENSDRLHLEGRFWNDGGNHIAVVACITKGVDWAAYIGTDAPHSSSEDNTLRYVADYGCKLLQKDAKHFFPEIKLPYRS